MPVPTSWGQQEPHIGQHGVVLPQYWGLWSGNLNSSQVPGQGSQRSGTNCLICVHGTVRMAQTKWFGHLVDGGETGVSPFSPHHQQEGDFSEWTAGPTVEVGPVYNKQCPSAPGNCTSTGAGLMLMNQTAPPPDQHCCIA